VRVELAAIFETTGRPIRRLILEQEAEWAGDPAHPEHEKYLLELGRTFYAVTSLAGICFDVLRVHEGLSHYSLYGDTLKCSADRLAKGAKQKPEVEGYQEFAEAVSALVTKRNDFIHSMPTAYGLLRNDPKKIFHAVEFYAIESLQALTAEFNGATALGSRVLYADDGAYVDRWYEQQSSPTKNE